MRINVPSRLQFKIREVFIDHIAYGKIDLKDVFAFLVTLALEEYRKGTELNYSIDENVVAPSASTTGTNMEIPIPISFELDKAKGELSMNKRDTFLAFLNAGFNIHLQKTTNAVQCATI
jgi:hypothetical protein